MLPLVLYNVSLTVTNAYGNDTEVQNSYIAVGTPSANMSGSTVIINGGTAFLTIDFVGNPPYEFTYSDGTSNFTETGITSNPYYLSVSPTDTTLYSIVQWKMEAVQETRVEQALLM